MSRYDDRPDSSRLTDLAVYIVPPELWREQLHSAVTQIIPDTISAGFIRVDPDLHVSRLRQEIEVQLGDDQILPRDYIFLKNVGRCLTRVRGKQERELKVKNFVPPQAHIPEIFLLEGASDIRSSVGSSQASSYRPDSRPVQQQPDPYALGSYRDDRAPLTTHRPVPPIQSDADEPITNSSQNVYLLRDPEKTKSTSSLRSNQSSFSNKQPLPDIIDNNKATQVEFEDENQNDKESKPATPVREKSVHEIKPEKHDNDKSVQTGAEDESIHTTPVPSEHADDTAKNSPTQSRDISPAPSSSSPTGPPSTVATPPPPHHYHPTPPPPTREQPPPLSVTPPRSAGTDTHKHTQHSTHDAHQERRRIEELQRKQLEEEERRRRELRELEDREKRLGDEEERWKRQRELEQQRLRHEEELRRQEEEHARRRDEMRRMEEDEARRRAEQDELRRQQDEQDRREQELRRRQQEEEERQRRLANEKAAQQGYNDRVERETPSPPPAVQNGYGRNEEISEQEKQALLEELDELRRERADAERKREELVKRAKQLQGKSHTKRNQARDVWKKKYFEEKKKTPPLEDQCNKLRQELESLHRKLMSTLEGGRERGRHPPDKPSMQSNFKIQATRLQHEIEDLQRRVDNIKMKLTAEMKLRNQAESELRALRAELTQKKINVTLARSSQRDNVHDVQYAAAPHAVSSRT